MTIALFADYVRSIRAARTMPHVFSWTIWAGTLIVFFAQLAGGVGAWPIGLSGCIAGYIAYLAYRKSDWSSIQPLDLPLERAEIAQ